MASRSWARFERKVRAVVAADVGGIEHDAVGGLVEVVPAVGLGFGASVDQVLLIPVARGSWKSNVFYLTTVAYLVWIQFGSQLSIGAIAVTIRTLVSPLPSGANSSPGVLFFSPRFIYPSFALDRFKRCKDLILYRILEQIFVFGKNDKTATSGILSTWQWNGFIQKQFNRCWLLLWMKRDSFCLIKIIFGLHTGKSGTITAGDELP